MNELKITDVKAREVYNGLYIPTLEVTIEVGNEKGTSVAPMGQSIGSDEAVELRDGGERFGGVGCLKAVEKIETELKELLIGMDVTQQRKIDHAMCELDGTPNKSRLGANALMAVSAAATVAAANTLHMPIYRYVNGNARIIPVPMMDYVSGGHYSYGASREIQEFSFLPIGADSLVEAMELSRKLYFALLDMVTEKFGSLAQSVNTSGGFSYYNN